MAPYIQESAGAKPVSKPSLLSESAVLNHDQVPKPVADDFMYDFKYNHSLPTTDILAVKIPTDCDAQKEAEGIVAHISAATSEGDAQGFAGLFLDYGEILRKQGAAISILADLGCTGVWRDKLSFSWDFRTFNFREAILKAATDPTFCLKPRLEISTLSSLHLRCLALTPTSLSCNLLCPSRLR